jgi:hypothetical protein
MSEVVDSHELRVFDFDDTLVHTDAMIGVTPARGKAFWLTPGEYAVYVALSGDVFDFSQFETVMNPTLMTRNVRALQLAVAVLGVGGVVVLTARGVAGPVKKFMHDVGLPEVEVVALGTGDPEAKARWISDVIHARGLKRVKFFDDSLKNVLAVRKLSKLHPGVDVIAVQV